MLQKPKLSMTGTDLATVVQRAIQTVGHLELISPKKDHQAAELVAVALTIDNLFSKSNYHNVYTVH